MGKQRPIGFLRESEPEQKKIIEKVAVKDVEAEFKWMISGLKMEETIYLREKKFEKNLLKFIKKSRN